MHFDVCNKLLGQSVASKVKDISLLNDTVERHISDIPEDQKIQNTLMEKIKLFILQLGELDQ